MQSRRSETLVCIVIVKRKRQIKDDTNFCNQGS